MQNHEEKLKFKLFNSITMQKEQFVPYNENEITIYLCGPTVYNEIHIGNARSLVVFDLLHRVLKTVYGKVVFVRNITDVDDKIIARAINENKHFQEVTQMWIDSFSKNCEKLNLLKPTFEPKVTDHMQEIISFIQGLIDNGFAYYQNQHVFFKIEKLPTYGALSQKNNLDYLLVQEINENKQNAQDFVLWKPANALDPFWVSPWGNGKPGWHIECSAMSLKYFGEKFDIHAGGKDLIFPHHENERAQNIGLNGENAGPRYWMHNAMLVINDQKMSKSLNNIILLSTLFEKYNPFFLRFLLLSANYKHILYWNEENVAQGLSRFDRWVNHLKFFKTEPICLPEIFEILCNDLNTPEAFAKFDELLSAALLKNNQNLLQQLANTLDFLSLMPKFEASSIPKHIYAQIELRNEYRKNKQYSLADEIRKDLLKQGYEISDLANETKIALTYQSNVV